MSDKILLRTMKERDIEIVARIHELAFPNFFLTRMGGGFLKAYYRTVLDFEEGIALVATRAASGEVAGFVTGFMYPDRFYTKFRKKRAELLPTILLSALRDPTLIGLILQNSKRIIAVDHKNDRSIELSSIAVTEKKLGLGTQLLHAFLAEAKKKNATTIFLTTDLERNASTRRFYENNGFSMTHIEHRGKRSLCHYSRPLK